MYSNFYSQGQQGENGRNGPAGPSGEQVIGKSSILFYFLYLPSEQNIFWIIFSITRKFNLFLHVMFLGINFV